MKQRPRIFPLYDFPGLLHRFYSANFIVHMHDGNQYRIVVYRFFQRFRGNNAVPVHRQINYFKSMSLQKFQRMGHRGMLHRRGYDTLSPASAGKSGTNQRQIIGLGASGCEAYFLFPYFQCFCDFTGRIPDIFFRLHPFCMQGRRIAIGGVHCMQHNIPHTF